MVLKMAVEISEKITESISRQSFQPFEFFWFNSNTNINPVQTQKSSILRNTATTSYFEQKTAVNSSILYMLPRTGGGMYSIK